MKKAFLAVAALALVVWSFKPTDSKDLAKVIPNQGIYVFVDCEPVAKYTVLGKIKDPRFVMGAKQVYFPYRRDTAIKKAKKEFPYCNGLIARFTDRGNDYYEVIKFD